MYDGLAEFYDLFMQDVDYKAIGKFASKWLAGCRAGADLGCGSGKTTFALKAEGFDVFGVDASEQMLRKAQENAVKSGENVLFVKAKAEKAVFPRKLDFMTAFCDVVNYCAKPTVLFQNVYKNLNENGVFIFDVSSEYKLRTVLANNTYTDESDGVLYVWTNRLTSRTVSMELSFFRREEDGRYRRFDETQKQTIHSTESILQALADSGFTDISVFGGVNGENPTAKSERLYFVARKKEGK